MSAPAVARVRARPNLGALAPAGMILTSALGALIVALAYRGAQDGGTPASYYATFWAGTLLLVGPFAAAALWDRTADRHRALALVGLGVATFVPKFLRNPYGALYHDELGHLRAVQDLATTGSLYAKNPVISIVGDYPGLHILTTTVMDLSGLTFWQSASTVLLLFHVATLIGVYIVARTLVSSGRIAALAAVIYATNPSYLYFHTQFAYESMAIMFFVWIMALIVIAAGATGRRRVGALALVVTLVVGTVMTHHLTTVTLIGVTALGLMVTVIVPRRWWPSPTRREWVPWAVALAAVVITFTLWILFVADTTYNYLRPYAARAAEQLLGQTIGADEGGGRTLYAGSVQPTYERLLGGLAPVVLLPLVLIAIVRSRFFAGWDARRTTLAIAVFGLIYFPSLPFILTTSGAEGARRSWGFTYIGVGICAAVCVAPWLWKARRGWLAGLVAAVALGGLLIGNTGAGLNDAYRFPGPYLFGSDTRSLTTEAVGLGEAFGEEYAGRRVVADRYTAMPLAVYGDAFTAAPSPGFPAYDLFFSPRDPSPYLVHMLESSDYVYIVSDSRLSQYVPLAGKYFTVVEPLKPQDGKSIVPEAALERFDTVPWATKVIATPHFSVYRVNFKDVGIKSCSTPGCRVATR